jgi:cephalosporin hydroxylase/predicted SAM-dependent methyltransferase
MPTLSELEKEAHRLLKGGSNMAALRVAEQAAKEHRTSPGAHHLHARIQEISARYEEALSSYRECVRLGGHGDAEKRVEVLQAALERPKIEHVPTGLRSWRSGMPLAALTSIQNALHNYKYKDTPLQKNPFDYALYPMLLWQFRPRTIIEIGSKEGGSALWFGDLCDTFGLDCQIHSVDIVRVATVKHKRVTFHEGDGRNLGGTFTEKLLKRLPRPWLVIEDADHSYETTHAVLEFFEDLITTEDMVVVEDGIISDLSSMEEGASGPHRALKKFLHRNFAEWEILPEWCDFFGYNFTWSSNGFLKRTGLKKLGTDVAPEQSQALGLVRGKDFAGALEALKGAASYGAGYLRAYSLWRLGRVAEAREEALAEVKQFAGHRQAQKLCELLTATLEGTRMEVAPRPRAPLAIGGADGALPMVNLGCGHHFRAGWVNVDVVPADASVHAHDLTQPLPFADGSCGVVYHSHVLEHLPKDAAPRFVGECYRVLAEGGILRVVVPDLEGIVRAYLNALEAGVAGDQGAVERHEWMTHELVDQLARHRSGGEMMKYWKQDPMPAEDFVFERVGWEVRQFVEPWRASGKVESKAVKPEANAVGTFRLGGEVHQWMYDRLSLGRLLAEAGFEGIEVKSAVESGIAGFAGYELDADEAGRVRKPDSLFMEARKPSA